jgi:uncharacterized protein YndB with AHSA1/START domain
VFDMQTLHFEKTINAPVDVVWSTMLDQPTYREWTGAFHEGSHYTGGWQKGEEIRFIGPNDDGTVGGMIGVIEENREHEFVSIVYAGLADGAVDDTTSDAARRFIGTHENYTFASVGDATSVTVDLDADDEFAPMFQEMWPKALDKLAEVAEAA